MIPDAILNPVIDRALAEDLAGGDMTTEATVELDARAIARATAKQPLVACGADIFARVFSRVDPSIRVERCFDDGQLAGVGDHLWIVEGRTRSILMAERTALNFVQRLSGTATLARRFVDALPKACRSRIVDTRKTTPGLRALERYAVRCGGAHNHRDCLGSAVLIKDNHIEAAGGISSAIKRARDYAPHTARIEVEVETLAGVDEALLAGADIVMLDNFPPEDIATALEKARGKALIEVSGGVSVERIAELGSLGVDIISVGALTHSAPSADISLNIERLGPPC